MCRVAIAVIAFLILWARN